MTARIAIALGGLSFFTALSLCVLLIKLYRDGYFPLSWLPV